MERRGIIFSGDFISFWISFFIVLIIRFNPDLNSEIVQSHILPFFILFLSWVLVFFIFGLYNTLSIKPNLLNIKRYILAIITSLIFGIILFYFVPFFGITPKINLILQIILFALFSFLSRRVIYKILSKTITRPLIIIGRNNHLDKLSKIIENNPQIGLDIVSYTNDENEVFEKFINNKNTLFIYENYPTYISDENITTLHKNNSEIIDIVKAYERYLQIIPTDYIDNKWFIDNINTKEDITYIIIRKIIDISIATLLLVIMSPFMILAILARLIEDGKPVFIKQKRVGLNGKIFNLYKIRSMIVLSKDGSAELNSKPEWATGKDPRITKIGNILRKTHLDEIPQMINVIKGDITIVGPRPERPEFVKDLENSIPHYKLRHIIKPGFTGWAQINYRYARSINDSKEKFEYDLFYIKNKNIFLDIGIIIKTIQIIFTH